MSEITAPARQERLLEGQSVARSLLTGMRSVSRSLDRVYLGMGLFCGGLMLVLALFITYQVIARKLGWAIAPGTVNMSGYALAMSATWAFSYGLRTGSHVRIDVLLPFMPRPLRAVADMVALAALLFFTLITAWKLWVMVLKSYELGTVTNDYPLTPLWIPQLVVAIGFSILGVTCVQMMVSMLAEWTLPRLHQLMGGTKTLNTIPEVAPGADGS